MSSSKKTNEEKEEGSLGGLGDVLKKAVSLGVGAAFMTEDAVKGMIKDIPLPKEVLNGLVQNAKNAKEDIVSSVRVEVKNYLSKVDPVKLAGELLEKYDVEVNATLKFKKKSEKKDE